MDFETIRVDFDDGVAVLTLNRPEKKNAMNCASAMEAQHTTRQDDSFRKERIGDFLDKKYRPGLGGHEDAKT